MLFKPLLFISIIFIVVSCNNRTADTDEEVSAADTVKPAQTDCYQYAHQHDTINLKMINDNGIVTGTLIYNLYEKDKNTGTVKGRMNDNVLIADYSFMSEGMVSTREVAFKKEGNFLVEGYGPVIEKDNKMLFKNKDSLIYNYSIKLTGINCK